MSALLTETLDLIDEIYPPTKKAVQHREMLIAASHAPFNELPYYTAQLSLMLTLLDNITASRSVDEMRGHVFKASVAFTVALGMLNQALGIITADNTETEGVVH
jgi:hypothetical protein